MNYDPLHSPGPGSGLPHTDSYWKDTFGHFPEEAAPLAQDREVEVAIIGAGYTGLAAAYFLGTEHHLETCVLEANRVGWGASGRNAGFALQSTGRLGASSMEKRWGYETAMGVLKEFRAGLATVSELIEKSGMEVDRQEEGFLKVGHSQAVIAGLKTQAELLRTRYDTGCRFVPREELHERYLRSEEAFGAIRYEDGFCLHPLKFVHGMYDLVRSAGIDVYTHTPVTTWTKEEGRHLLHTPQGVVRAKHVIAAGNAYSPRQLHPLLENRTLPVLTSVIVTNPLTEEARKQTGYQTHQGVMDTRKLKYYYRLLPDNRILFGGRGAIRGKDADNPIFQHRLRQALISGFPCLSDIQIEYAWNGWITISLDDVPRVCAIPEDPTIYYATGYSGCGLAYSAQAGRRLAEKVTGTGDAHTLPIHTTQLKKFPLPWLKRVGQFGYYQYGRLYDWIK